MPATQQPPMVSLHRSWKTLTLPVDNPSGCLVHSSRSWLNPAIWGPGTSLTCGWTMAPSICGGRKVVSPLKAMGLRISLRLNTRASSLLRNPAWRLFVITTPNNNVLCGEFSQWLRPHPGFHTAGPRHWGQHQHLPSNVQLGYTVAYIPGGNHRGNQWWPAWCVRLCYGSLARYQALFGWLGLFPIQWHRPAYQISLPMRVAAAGIQCA